MISLLVFLSSASFTWPREVPHVVTPTGCEDLQPMGALFLFHNLSVA